MPQLAISEHFTVNLHKSLIGALSFNFARHRQLRQHAVTTSASLSAVVCRSICCSHFHCLLSCGGAFFKISFSLASALQALLKALVLALACAAFKCACKCVGYFPFIVTIISSKLSIPDFKFSIMSFANKSGSGKLSRSVRLLSFIQVISRLVLSRSIISS